MTLPETKMHIENNMTIILIATTTTMSQKMM